MARSSYSAGKRERERRKERKRQEKARRRETSGSSRGVPVASADDIQGGLMSIDEVVQSVYAPPEAEPRSNTVPSRLFIGGLNFSVTTEQLREELEKFGKLTDVFVVLDRDTGDSRGFGFVTFADRRDAARAINELHSSEFHGRTLVVRLATER